ncbi:MAG: hypothetical protein AB7R89_21680 [Dehalococcoidia bacterium]
MPRLLVAVLLIGAVALVACEDGSDVTAEQAQDRINETSDDVQAQADDVWADLRTDGERLIDEVQTRNDSDAKDQLLDRCRNAEEQLRKDDNANADRVNELCDDIRNADPDDSQAWTTIKARFDELSNEFRN